METKWLKIGAIICSPLLVIGFQNCSKLGTNGIAVDDKVLTLDGTQVVNDPAMPSNDPAAAGASQPVIPPSASGSTESTNPNPNPIPGQSSQTNPQDIALVTSEIPKNMNPEDEELDNEDESDEDEQEFESCDRDDKGKDNRSQSDGDKEHGDKEHGDKEHGDKEHGDKKIADNKKDHENFIIDDSIEALVPLIKGCNVDRPLSENAQEVDIKFDHESIDVDALSLKRLKGTMGVVTVRATTDSSEAKIIKVNHSVVVLCDFAEIKKIKGVHNHIVVVGGEIDTVKLNNSTLSLVNATIGKFKGTNTKVNTYSLK